jgi:hypothetical protein
MQWPATDPGQVGQWGPVVDWPVVGIPRGVASERQGARLGLGRRCRDRDLPRAQLHAGDGATTRHGDADAGDGGSGVQHLLLRVCASVRRVGVHCRREQERAARGDRQDAPVQPGDVRVEPRPDMAAGRWYPSVTL